MRRRTAGYDSQKSGNSVNGVIEKLQNGSVNFLFFVFCGQCFVGGSDILPALPMGITVYLL